MCLQVIDVLAKYELDLKNCVGITRDNGANIKKAFEGNAFASVFNFPCACHSLNLMFHQIFKKNELIAPQIEIVEKVRMFFSNNRQQKILLMNELKKVGLNVKAFPSPCPTRWWSLQFVLSYFVENQLAINNAFQSSSLKRDEVIYLSKEFFAIVVATEYLGAELAEVSTKLESDCEPTLSLILPFIHNFSNRLFSSSVKETIFQKTKTIILQHFSFVNEENVKNSIDNVFIAFENTFQDFQRKYTSKEMHERLAIATLLDPRFKSGKIFDFEQKQKLLDKIWSLMDLNETERPVTRSLTQVANESNQVSSDSFFEDYEESFERSEMDIDQCISNEESDDVSDDYRPYGTEEEAVPDDLGLELFTESQTTSVFSQSTSSLKRCFAEDSDVESDEEVSSVKIEYNQFVTTSFKKKESIWAWFIRHEKSFPRVQKIAFDYLLLPASSASAERVFSRAGNIITSKRICLGTETSNELIILSGNRKILEEI